LQAYTGFSLPFNPRNVPIAVASGKWGCGAFNGNPELKVVLQLMAATEAGRDIAIFAFGDAEFQQTVVAMYELMKNKTVGRSLYKFLVSHSLPPRSNWA